MEHTFMLQLKNIKTAVTMWQHC